MKGRLMFAAGITTGFILGSRAGRQAYDQIMERVQSFTGNPRVQEAVDKAKDVAEAKAPEATARVKQAAQSASQNAKAATDTAKSVADEATKDSGTKDSGTKTPSPRSTPSTPKPTSTPTPTPNTIADFSSADESIAPTSAI